ncbi:MAG: hypothetical protein JJ863_28300 [Deltaproteobacteria bacterium]|nr:hypothetical protein [Deltaproteobacteria bacterium]
MRWLALALFLIGSACGGDVPFGEPCQSHEACADDGRCVEGVDGPAAVCTKSCSGDDRCPEGWSCSVATEDGLLVCRRGAATPFGY